MFNNKYMYIHSNDLFALANNARLVLQNIT